MDTAKIATYVDLRRRQRERKAEFDEVKKEADELEQQILEVFAEEGTDSIRIKTPDGKRRTVFLRREVWAKVEGEHTPAAVCDALREAGLGDLVKEGYSTQSLSAYLRELEKEAEESEVAFAEVLPVELRGVIGTTEKFSVRDRAG